MSFFYGYVSSKDDQTINSKVHNSLHSPSYVPFSWEQQPGICKTSQRPRPISSRTPARETGRSSGPKLPLPPCQTMPNKSVGHSLAHTPPLPCAFRQRQSSRNDGGSGAQRVRKNKDEEDPFVSALLECTRDAVDQKTNNIKKNERKNVSVGIPVKRKLRFSCKQACVVRENSIVRNPRSLHPTPPTLHSSQSSCKPSAARMRSADSLEKGY